MDVRLRAVILKNELEDDHLLWVAACEKYKDRLSYRVVDLTRSTWFNDIREASFDVLLAKPGAITSALKQVYDERVYILTQVLGYKLYPSMEEVFIYENKRFLATWLEARSIPHPATKVFYSLAEAKAFLATSPLPLVAKTNIGASGRGVVVLRDREKAVQYAADVFSGKGATRSVGPNMQKSGLLKRGVAYLLKPGALVKKLRFYRTVAADVQKDFVIFQQFVPHEFEWRVVRIGDSFFAHKKLKLGEKASGSLLKNYDNPPLAIFDFVKELTDKYGLLSQAVDVFEADGKFLVNEMQCIFGQSDSFQMKVDGVIGRYIYLKGVWTFEAGDFNGNESYDLRIKHVIDLCTK